MASAIVLAAAAIHPSATRITDPEHRLAHDLSHARLVLLTLATASGPLSAAIQHLWSAGYRAAFQLAERLDRRHPLWNIRRIIVPELSGRELLREIRRDF